MIADFGWPGRAVPITACVPDYGVQIGRGTSYDAVMVLRVVGAGHGRTGTYSLKLALERLLGGRCHHMAEIVADPEHHLPLWAPVLRGEDVDWEEVFAGYVAQTDFPGAAFWRELERGVPRRSRPPLNAPL